MTPFSFGTNTAITLTLEELESSRQSQNQEIASWDFIRDIIAIMVNRSIDYKHEGCVVRKDSSKISPTRSEKETYADGNFPIDVWIFNRVAIHFIIPVDEEFSVGIAAIVTERGFQLGYGISVNVCSNMTILRPDYLTSTFSVNGGPKYSYQEMLDRLDSWLNEQEKNFQDDVKIIRKLRSIDVSSNEVQRLFGWLLINYYREAVVPSNSNPIIGVEMLADIVKHYNSKIKEQHEFTAWEFLNLGTSVIKPANYQLASYIHWLTSWTNFCYRMFKIDIGEITLPEEAIVVEEPTATTEGEEITDWIPKTDDLPADNDQKQEPHYPED